MGIADKREAKVLVTRIIKKVIASIYRRSLIPSISIYLGQLKFTKRTIANIKDIQLLDKNPKIICNKPKISSRVRY